MKARITVETIPHTPHVVYAEYAKQNIADGVPLVRKDVACGKPLAIVGGGHPLDLVALQCWGGDIWAGNATHDHLLAHGIKSTLFMCDPWPGMVQFAHKAEHAILGSICHPDVFALLKGKAEMFHIGDVCEDAPFIALGVNTALSRAFAVGVYMGYETQHYFGCSGSYADVGSYVMAHDKDFRDAPERFPSHVYDKPLDHSHDQELIILADGAHYRSNLALMQQCEFFASMFSLAPHYFKERSGGLLRAMMRDSDWGVTHASECVQKMIQVQK